MQSTSVCSQQHVFDTPSRWPCINEVLVPSNNSLTVFRGSISHPSPAAVEVWSIATYTVRRNLLWECNG